MARFEGYTCDICGVQRGPSNHWLLAVAEEDEVKVMPWNETSLSGYLHLCGEGCATKVLSRQIQAWMVQ